MKKILITALSLVLLAQFGCIEKMALPNDINKAVDFTAGDTTYLAISPAWDASYGFVTPTELSIALDGRIFIADSAGHSISELLHLPNPGHSRIRNPANHSVRFPERMIGLM